MRRNNILKWKLGKGADEAGLTAELLRDSPFFSNTFPEIISRHFLGQYVPCFWHVTFFEMFATKIAQVDREISGLLPASIFPIKWYKMYFVLRTCCLIASRRFLNVAQPEEQHDFKGKYSTGKHTSTANLLLDKTADANVQLWIISLDLSKAFVLRPKRGWIKAEVHRSLETWRVFNWILICWLARDLAAFEPVTIYFQQRFKMPRGLWGEEWVALPLAETKVILASYR